MDPGSDHFSSNILASSQMVPPEGVPPSTPANMEVDTGEQQQQQHEIQIQPRRINPFNTGGITKVVDELAESVKETFVKFLEE